jgi:hypothetical protein
VIGRVLALTAALSCSMLVGACSKTTFDASLIATTTVVTTTTLPTGTPAELLPLMVAEVGGLSTKIAARNGDQESASLIEHYWAAMKPEIQSTHPEFVDSFDFIVRRCRQGSDRHRPADADRAYKNILELQTAILG